MSSINKLLDIMRQLRDPQTGCPWDLEQDFKSIAPYTIEEAYEVADAIERNDLDDLKDELGDLLLQVVFHSQMAQEAEEFNFDDVVDAICDKMTRRHPHVFAGESIGDAEAQTRNWEALKEKERQQKRISKTTNGFLPEDSILSSVTAKLPSLTRAKKLTKKAAKVGFDWSDAGSVMHKVDEELDELKEAIASSDINHINEEFGDLMFVMANLARKLNIDPDASLRSANQKFIRRFHFIEKQLTAQSKLLQNASLEEMDTLWNLAKIAEKTD